MRREERKTLMCDDNDGDNGVGGGAVIWLHIVRVMFLDEGSHCRSLLIIIIIVTAAATAREQSFAATTDEDDDDDDDGDDDEDDDEDDGPHRERVFRSLNYQIKTKKMGED